jgi:hypothetical protein
LDFVLLLRSNNCNERRFAAFAIGSIGSTDPSFVKDVLPLLIQYASDPDSVRKELEIAGRHDSTIKRYFSISISMGVDDATWLRDACIDALGMIGKRFPESVNSAIPMLEKLTKDAPSPYTVKKAIKALDAIRGNYDSYSSD